MNNSAIPSSLRPDPGLLFLSLGVRPAGGEMVPTGISTDSEVMGPPGGFAKR